MPSPSVSITKTDYQTGSTGPSPVGALAIIAPAQAGPQNTPQSFARDDLAWNVFGPSPLAEAVSYDIAVSGNPPIAIRPTASTAASYGAVDVTGMVGTSIPTAGAAVPADSYDVLVTFTKGGTIGITGITYTYSLDGGNTTSAPQALGTLSTLTIPNFNRGGSPGVSFAMGAGTILVGDFFRCLTAHAKMTDADLATSLEALRVSSLPYEAILLDEEAGAGTVGIVDTWLAAREKEGKFKLAFLNTRMKNQLHVGAGTAETEAAYATAMTTLVASQTPSIRLSQGTDGSALPSTMTGLLLSRPAAYEVAARTMAIPVGVEPAYVALGALTSAIIADANGNPAYHDEFLYQNLDALLLTALRTVPGQRGVFVNNGRIFSQVGSDFVLIPHARTMNRACEIAFQLLTAQLSRGVGKKPRDATTGQVYIAETDALSIEGLVNPALADQLKNQVQAVKFTLSRTDDLSGNTGATVNATIAIVALAYIKKFAVVAAFSKSIAVPAA